MQLNGRNHLCLKPKVSLNGDVWVILVCVKSMPIKVFVLLLTCSDCYNKYYGDICAILFVTSLRALVYILLGVCVRGECDGL